MVRVGLVILRSRVGIHLAPGFFLFFYPLSGPSREVHLGCFSYNNLNCVAWGIIGLNMYLMRIKKIIWKSAECVYDCFSLVELFLIGPMKHKKWCMSKDISRSKTFPTFVRKRGFSFAPFSVPNLWVTYRGSFYLETRLTELSRRDIRALLAFGRKQRNFQLINGGKIIIKVRLGLVLLKNDVPSIRTNSKDRKYFYNIHPELKITGPSDKSAPSDTNTTSDGRTWLFSPQKWKFYRFNQTSHNRP